MNRYFKIHFIAIFISVLFLGAMLTVTPANAMGRFWPLPNPEPPPVEEPPVPGDTSCPNPIPTLLIHGFLGNPSNMEPLERYLIDNGWPQAMLSRPSIPNTSLLHPSCFVSSITKIVLNKPKPVELKSECVSMNKWPLLLFCNGNFLTSTSKKLNRTFCIFRWRRGSFLF